MRRLAPACLLFALLVLALSSLAQTEKVPVDTQRVPAATEPNRVDTQRTRIDSAETPPDSTNTPSGTEKTSSDSAQALPDTQQTWIDTQRIRTASEQAPPGTEKTSSGTPQTSADTQQAPADTAQAPAEPAPTSIVTQQTLTDTGLVAARSLLDQRRRDRSGGIEYRADVYLYSQTGDSLILRGDPASVTYRKAKLEAAELVYRRDQNTVEARARIDSSGALIGEPVLKQGDETLRGVRILYDLESEQGTILEARIQQKKGYFSGERIHTVSAAEFHVRQGSYSTCDYPEPHFDFYSPRIKVIMDDMAIARPVYFRVAQKRVFWIPFYIFSLREDRQSGILTPTFGRRPLRFGSSQTEWELRNLGYYFAPSDYWDLTLAGDLRQRSGWLARLDLAYARRYHWNGKIDLQFENRQDGDRLQRAWRVDLSHSQELSPTSQVRASGTFQSNKSFNRDNSADLQDRLNRTLRSNLSYSKRWKESGNSLSLNASQTKNLDTETFDVVLPEISLRKARKPLWGGSPAVGSARNAEPWYSRIYYDGSARLRNSQRGTTADTTQRTSADLGLRVSSQFKPFSYLQISPSLGETWRDDDLRTDEMRNLRTDQLSATASLTQTLYGLFHPPLWRVDALRHVLKPNLSLSYQATRADTGGIAGLGGDSGSWKQRRQLNLRLDNSFWAKIERGEEEAKVRLAQLNFSTAYDFEDDDRPLADLSTTLSVDAGRLFDTRLTMRSEFYDEGDQLHLFAPRIRQTELRTSVRYTARGQTTQRDDTRQSSLASAYGQGSADRTSSLGSSPYGQQDFGYESGLRSDIQGSGRGTSLQLSHYYSRTRSSSSELTRSWVRTSLGFDLGAAQYRDYTRPRWHFDYSVNYDLHAPEHPFFSTGRITSELLSIRRDFHDWTATFNFEPFSFHRNRTFFFKAQLRDIPQLKFERGDSRL